MMSVHFLADAKSTSKYFSHEDSYYLVEDGAQKSGRWIGKGAESLGLTGKQVSSQDLENLLSGKLPNNETVGASNTNGHKHRPGIQLVFSAPKSVSLFALASQDKALSETLQNAHQNAVHFVLSKIENDCAQARYKEKGGFRYENSKNIIAAAIDHALSRENDPQLHTHALIMNITRRLDGKWRSMASSFNNPNSDEINGFNERIINNKIYYGALYRSKLAEIVKSLGFEIEIVGRHGMWEIKNFPQELLSFFSKRREQVLQTMENAEYKTQKAFDTAATISKRPKENNLSIATLKQCWHSEINELNFNLDKVHKSITIKNNSKITTFADEKTNEVVEDVINHFSSFRNKISVSKIVEKTLTLYPGDIEIDKILNAIDNLSKKSKLFFLNDEKSNISIQTALAMEKNIIESIQSAKKSLTGLEVDRYKAGVEHNLKNEYKICRDILFSTDRCHLIDVNENEKQALFSTMLQSFELNKKTIRFLSPNTAMAHDNQESVRRQSTSIWGIFKNSVKPELISTVSGFLHKIEKEKQNIFHGIRKQKDILIVDSVEKISLPDLERLIAATKNNKTQLVFINNSGNKVLSQAGNVISTIKASSIQTHTYHNEKTDKINKPIQTILISEQDDKKRADNLAKAYCMMSLSERNSTKIISYNKSSVVLINDSIREQLKEAGDLSKNEYEYSFLKPVSFTRSEKQYAASFKEGMLVRIFNSGQKPIDYNILKINKERNEIILKSTGQLFGFEKQWNPRSETLNFSVFEKETLKIAEGDKIRSTLKNHSLGIKAETHFQVKSINEKTLTLLDRNQKVVKISKKEFETAHFNHDYVDTINKVSKKNDNLIFFTKSYAVDKETINTLKDASNSNLIIFSDLKEKTEFKLKQASIQPTAYEILKDAISRDRIVSTNTIEIMKSDISSIITTINNKKPDLAEKAILFAIEKLSNSEACFTHKSLLQEAVVFAMANKTTVADLENKIKEAHQSGKLLISQAYSDGTRWTTQEAVNTENKIIEIVNKSVNSQEYKPILSEDAISTDKTHGLTGGQKAAYKMIMTSTDQFLLLQGSAGVGKTTLFQKINNDVKESGIVMFAVAPTHQAVKELLERNINAKTLRQFINDNQYANTTQPDKLIILDEASMASSKDMKDFLEIMSCTKMRAVISGDRDQNASIESGKSLELLLDNSNLKRCIIKDRADIVRQKNEHLKSAVVSVIDKNYQKAISILKIIKPDEKLWTNQEKNKFDVPKNCIIEAENNIFERVANDYLNRTDLVRKNTCVIVHANEDRREVDNRIRNGLVKEGVIDMYSEIKHTRLISYHYSTAELSSIQYYKKNDVIKIKSDYFSISSVNADKNSVVLKPLDKLNGDQEKVIFPGKETKQIELFKTESCEIAKGDKIRLRKSDLKSERFSNFEYAVSKIDKDTLHLENISGHKITFEKDKLSDSHWDYAYTSTGYSIQGASIDYTIGLELSIRKNLTNSRNFYVHISRSKENAIIYTDSIEKLTKKIDGNRAKKTSALELLAISKKETVFNNQKNNNSRPLNIRDDFKDIDASLKHKTSDILLNLLGKPNEKLSTENNWRYGQKGSLSVQINGDRAGLWHSFESGESGNLLQLIKKETGYEFKDALSYAKKLSGFIGQNEKQKQREKSIHEKNNYLSGEKIEKPINAETQAKIDRVVNGLKPIQGTVVEKYLRVIRKIDDLSNTKDIYYHDSIYDSSSTSGIKNKSAMVVVGRNSDHKIVCLQSTFLDPKTAQKADDTEIKKRSFGAISGHPAIIQDGEKTDKSLSFIAEGVETALSIKQATGSKSQILVSMGVSNLKNIPIDRLNKTVVIIADNDGVNASNLKQIEMFAKRLIENQHTVLIATPKQMPGLTKSDYNDVLVKQGADAVKKSISEAVFYHDWKEKSYSNNNLLQNDSNRNIQEIAR